MTSDNPTILVVDDDAETVRIFDMFLSKQGYNVLIAKSVPEAMNYLNDVVPAIILLDVMLPGTNGLELLKFIRSEPHLRHIYVIVISAHTIEDYPLPSGVEPDDVLRKPIRIPQLRETLSKALA